MSDFQKTLYHLITKGHLSLHISEGCIDLSEILIEAIDKHVLTESSYKKIDKLIKIK